VVKIGAHLHSADPFAGAEERKADVVQFFLGDPQSYKGPVLPDEPDAIREQATKAGIDLYVHAPYPINIATMNNRIRIPSRKLLAQHADAAASFGAKAVIVHGGHMSEGDDPARGFDNWRKTFDRWTPPLPILIENTAGGDNAMARRFDRLAMLWDALDGFDVGFCLDTCHAHAGGEELLGIVDRVKAITGRIDLIHANGSKDPFDSGRDRHENFGSGQIDPQLIVAVVEAAGASVVCETPADGQASDITFLREHLPA
jgi:deoxyribonuclease-4